MDRRRFIKTAAILGVAIAGGVYPYKMTQKQIDENPGKVRVDLHNHLASGIYRGDSNTVIEIAKKRLGPGGILGVANSYHLDGTYDNRYEVFLNSFDFKEIENLGNAFYAIKKDILVLKAQEIEHPEGHILVLGLPEDYNINRKTIEDSFREANDLGTSVSIDHPFFFQGLGPYLEKHLELLKKTHGFEVHNGEALYGNKKAKEFYEIIKGDYDVGAMSFSDGHSLYEIARSWTILNKPSIENKDRLNETLKKSMQEHKDYSEDEQYTSFFGALDHATKMVLSEYLGLRRFFE